MRPGSWFNSITNTRSSKSTRFPLEIHQNKLHIPILLFCKSSSLSGSLSLHQSSMASASLLLPSISLSLLFFIFISNTHLTLSITKASLDLRRPLSSVADVHDLLPLYGLPKGILPGNVRSYSLANDTGSFSIELTSTCYVDFDQLVYYDKKIKGKLSYGAVTDVSGIQAKKLFLWLPVTGMEKVKGSDTVRFFVGSLSEDLPAKQFEDIPVCERKASLRTDVDSM